MQQIYLHNRPNAKYCNKLICKNRHIGKNCHANGANSENRENIVERTELNSSDMIRSNSPHRYSCGKGTHLYVFINQSHLLICLRVSKTHREMSLFSAGGVLVIVYKENQTFPFFLVNGEFTMGHLSNVSS